ncbi:MAG: extracellular solute-binding protein [Propionibacteriaceae bacterium]
MSVSRRRFLSLTGGLAATAVGLTACGSNTGRPESSSSSSGGSSAALPQLSQWYHEYGEDGVEAAVKKYAASYDKAKITVKWSPGEYEKLVSAALLTAKVPDIFEYGNGPTLDMIKANQVLDLTDTVGAAKDEFAAPVIAPMIWEDKVWAIPQTVDMQMLYYRKSLLAKAGVQPPKTLDELIDAAKAVQTKDMGGFFAGNDGGLGVLGSMLIWSAGFEYLNDEKTGIGFADPAMYAGLKQFAGFNKDNGLLESASADWFDPAPLINGEAAMQWSGLWVLPEVEDALKDDIGVVPFPSIGSAGRQAVPTGAFSACVSAKGVDPDAAKEFVKWLWIDQEADQVDFSNSYGTHIPAKTKLAPQADKLAEGAGAEAAKFVADLGHGPDLLWTPAIQQAYTAALSNIVKKGADPQAEIAKVASKATQEIKRVNG